MGTNATLALAQPLSPSLSTQWPLRYFECNPRPPLGGRCIPPGGKMCRALACVSLTLPPHVHMVRAGGREYFYYPPLPRHEARRQSGRSCQAVRAPRWQPNAEWWAAYRRLIDEPEPPHAPITFAHSSRAYGMPRSGRLWQRAHDAIRRRYTQRSLQRCVGRSRCPWASNRVMCWRFAIAYADVPPPDPEAYAKPLQRIPQSKGVANGLLRTLSAMLSWGVLRDFAPTIPQSMFPKLESGEGYPSGRCGRSSTMKSTANPIWAGRGLRALHRPTTKRRARHDAQPCQRRRGAVWCRRRPASGPVDPDAPRPRIQAEMPRTSTTSLTNSRGRLDVRRLSRQLADRNGRGASQPFGRNAWSFHGLRKSAVVFLLEAGCRPPKSPRSPARRWQMVEHYAKQVNQKKLARAAILSGALRSVRTLREPSL